MKTLLNVVLAGLPPTVNHMYRNSGHVRYKTAECRDYQRITTALLSHAWGKSLTYKGKISLEITFTAKNKRRWDIDNRVKPVQDCLIMAGIIKDDSQIEILHVERKYEKQETTDLIIKECEGN